MKKDNLQNKSTEKLEADLKTVKAITGALIGVLIVLFAVNLYGLFTKDKNVAFIGGMVVSISLSAILPLQFSSIKKIKTELKVRGNNN